jgi:hydrogenase maturation protease
MLLLGFGNPARGDDGLGPALAQELGREPVEHLHTLWDYQPAVEHAAELAEHDTVVFVDAAMTGPGPFRFHELLGRAAESFTSHNLAPEAVVALAREALGWRGRAYLLAIRGYEFEAFHEGLSAGASANLCVVCERLRACIAAGSLESLVTDAPTPYSDLVVPHG